MAEGGTKPGDGQATHRDNSTSLDPLRDLPLVVESGGRVGLLISLSMFPSMGGGGTLGMGPTPSGGLPWVMFQYICWLLIVQCHSRR